MEDDLVAREEAKRERNYNPKARWAAILSMIEWVQAQLPPEQRRNTPLACKRAESARLPLRPAVKDS